MPLGISAAMHLSLLVALFALKPGERPPLPPLYSVNLVAAPPGTRAIGVTTPAPTPSPAKPATPPPMAPSQKTDMPSPVRSKTPPRPAGTQTPDASTKQPVDVPKAAGGPTGGTGTDVATVQTPGIDFPFPGYLNNIVRQIALNFKPRNPNAPLRAEVRFVIRRNGTVDEFRFLTRSGSYAFDLDVQGAVEAAQAGFGPLPQGYNDDVLPIIFSFDPRVLR